MPIVEKKEGNLVELVKYYLDSKKFDSSIIKSTESNRIVIGDHEQEISIKEDECRMVMTHNYSNDIDIGSSIRNIPGGIEKSKKMRLTTRKDNMNMDIKMDIYAYEGTPGVRSFVGDGNINVSFKNRLNKPSENTEIFDIDCICQRKKLRCTGTRETFKI